MLGQPTAPSWPRQTLSLPGIRKRPSPWSQAKTLWCWPAGSLSCPRQVIIKLGEAGAVALIGGNDYQPDAFKVPVVDTVGAGDAFAAGYIAELLNGLDPHQRLDTAVRTGAFACLVSGDWEGMARREELGMLEQSEPVAR